MALQAFIIFPETDDEVSNSVGLGNEFELLLKRVNSLIKYIYEQQNIKLYYDAKNIDRFLQQCSYLIDEQYLQKPKNVLRSTLGRKARNVQEHLYAPQSGCCYIHWQIDNYTTTPASTMLSEITERSYHYPDKTYLLLNIADATPTNRAFLTVFKDAKHIHGLPDKFVHIPFVADKPELEIWLSTNHKSTFTLLDRNRFQRTSGFHHGKPIFREIDTGRYWYLDNFHKDEYEVFNTQRQHIGVADLDGEIDYSKRKAGRTFDY